MSIVGDNIRRIRSARGMLQVDLGEQIGKTQKAISSWERGARNPSNDDVRALAKALGVAPAEIIGHNEMNDSEFELIVTSDDMSPEIKHGDTLTVNSARQPNDGDLVVIEICDAAKQKEQLVRRLYRFGRMLSLLAVNPAVQPINADKDDIHIKGTVTELRRKV